MKRRFHSRFLGFVGVVTLMVDWLVVGVVVVVLKEGWPRITQTLFSKLVKGRSRNFVASEKGRLLSHWPAG